MLNHTEKDCTRKFENFRWSFSSVNTYRNCPFCFFLSYLQYPPLTRAENAFAQWGSFMHSLYERFYKGQIDFFDACDEYEQKYKEKITVPFPANAYVDLGKRYYQSGLDALERFSDLPDNLEILEIEGKISITIKDIPFIGFADLILRDKEKDEIIVIDHKSKSKFASATEQKKYARQLYLYSLYVKEKYGKYPSQLVFNMFRVGKIVKIPFNQKDLDEAVQWFVDTVSDIYMDLDFFDKIYLEYQNTGKDIAKFNQQDFFCNTLCSVREYCERSKSE